MQPSRLMTYLQYIAIYMCNHIYIVFLLCSVSSLSKSAISIKSSIHASTNNNARLNIALDAVWAFNSASIESLSSENTLQASSHFGTFRKTSNTCSGVFRPCEAGSNDFIKENKGESKKRNSKISSSSNSKKHDDVSDAVGCCKSNELMYLYNVHINFVDNKVSVFDKSIENTKCSQIGSKIPYLPTLVTANDINLYQKHHKNSLRHNNRTNANSNPLDTPIKLEYTSNTKSKYITPGQYCKDRKSKSAGNIRIFHGTVHIIGAHTVHNLFHALNDNIIPVLSLFILDKYFHSEFLHLPRILVLAPGASLDKSAIPHFKLLKDLFVEVIAWSDMKELCATRVIWGSYLRPFYNPTASILNSLSTDLLRELALSYAPPIPSALISTSNYYLNLNVNNNRDFTLSSYQNQSLQSIRLVSRHNASSPLRIVIFSRGSSGRGRSIRGEAALASALRRFGAAVAICGNFSNSQSSFMDQLGHALYADVIIGLHGAGLANFAFSPVNSILVELKTIYGHNLDLFYLVSSARRGFHVEIDIKNYFVYRDSKHPSETSKLLSAPPLSKSSTSSSTFPISQPHFRSLHSSNTRHSDTGGHMPIDKPLISRVINGILLALGEKSINSVYYLNYSFNKSSTLISSGTTDSNDHLQSRRSYDILSTPSFYFNQKSSLSKERIFTKTNFKKSVPDKSKSSAAMEEVRDDLFSGLNLFGPRSSASDLRIYCDALPLSRYRKMIGANPDYCQGCD